MALCVRQPLRISFDVIAAGLSVHRNRVMYQRLDVALPQENREAIALRATDYKVIMSADRRQDGARIAILAFLISA